MLMPRRPPSPCTWQGHPRCPALVEGGGRCPAHKRPAWAGPRRRADLTTSSWQRTRLRILRRDGHSCQTRRPQGGVCGMPADQVDHIIPVAEGGTSEDHNLAAICDPCHRTKSLAEATRGAARARARRGRSSA